MDTELALRRCAHLRRHLADAGIDVAVLTNPVSIRYATGYRGYATFQSRIPSAYLILPVEGPVILHGAYTDGWATIDECRTAHSITAFDAGLDPAAAIGRFVADIDVARAEAGLRASAVVGLERATPATVRKLDTVDAAGAVAGAGFPLHDTVDAAGAVAGAGFPLHDAAGAGFPLHVVDAEGTIELARSRKIAGELDAMRGAISVAELGMTRMWEALEPGITENQLFAELHRTNIEHDGDWIDGRMLCSGPRTNPWYQEAGFRPIEQGELVAFDTDMVGPGGYCADISRTWVCGAEPTEAQRELHARARDEIEHNLGLLRVGASFAEISQASFRQPDRFVANRYACIMHGVGMTDEYPKIPYPQDWHWTGYDGEIEDGLVLSVESYVGAEGGSQGVKLEQMVQVTDAGIELLSHFPTDLCPAP